MGKPEGMGEILSIKNKKVTITGENNKQIKIPAINVIRLTAIWLQPVFKKYEKQSENFSLNDFNIFLGKELGIETGDKILE